jgi:hypothetical protein
MRNSTSACVAIVGCLLVGLSVNANAGQWDVVINGKSIHLDAERDWNESNWGLGFEHEFNPDSRWVKLALGNGFRDSDDQLSYMAGGGIKRRFRLPIGERRMHADLGAIGFMMTRQDVNNSQPFPGILPAFSVGTRQFSVNMTYLPGHIADEVTHARASDPDLDGIVFIQFKLSPRLFGFGNSGRRDLFASN